VRTGAPQAAVRCIRPAHRSHRAGASSAAGAPPAPPPARGRTGPCSSRKPLVACGQWNFGTGLR
jgi:hypothetical protein